MFAIFIALFISERHENIEYLPGNRNDSEGLDVVRRISEFVQSAETEFVCRIKDASFIVAATYDIYHRFHSVLQEMHWALTDYSNPLLSATEGIRMFGGLTSWTGLDCWICNTNRAAWYKQAMENERQNGYSLAIVPVPVRFKHHFKTGCFDNYDCYALGDYIATYGTPNTRFYNAFIYRFKDGKPIAGPWETVRLVEQAMRREEKLAGKLSDAILTVIPASGSRYSHSGTPAQNRTTPLPQAPQWPQAQKSPGTAPESFSSCGITAVKGPPLTAQPMPSAVLHTKGTYGHRQIERIPSSRTASIRALS